MNSEYGEITHSVDAMSSWSITHKISCVSRPCQQICLKEHAGSAVHSFTNRQHLNPPPIQ